MGDHLLVDGHVHVQIVDAELLELLRPGGFVRYPHEVDHDLRTVPTRRLDGLLRGEEGPLPMHVVQGDLQDGLHGPCLPRAHDKYVTTRADVAARVSKKGYETAA